MQQAPGQPTSPFPPTLEHVPAEACLTETFAFTPGALAVGGLLGLVGSFVLLWESGARRIEDLYLPIGCAVVGVIFGGLEIFRRMRRTTVAFQGSQIGIYRGGKLTDVAYRSQIAIYKLSMVNTVRAVLGFGFLALLGLLAGLSTISRDPGMGLVLFGAGVGFGGGFVSSIYERLACRHFLVPAGQGTEQVMFLPGGLGRFGY